ncbi:MAG: orotidine 5'-phosphate decarboxylase / HUMPS family protein [Nitrososphaerota archaeon]
MGSVGSDPKERRPVKLWEIARKKQSRLIIALDVFNNLRLNGREVIEKYSRLLETCRDFIVGVKIGLPLLLKAGSRDIQDLIEKFKEDFYMIADFKLADIPEIVNISLKIIKDIGFDGSIIHLFQGGLQKISLDTLDIFGVLIMSHPEAKLLEENIDRLIIEASSNKIVGVVVGATKEHFIREVRRKLSDKTIISPGVVTQGGEIGASLRCGSDFEIIGRAVTFSEDPLPILRRIVEVERNVLKK